MFVRFHRDITDAKIDTLGTITSICSISLGPSTETKISNVLQTSNYMNTIQEKLNEKNELPLGSAERDDLTNEIKSQVSLCKKQF